MTAALTASKNRDDKNIYHCCIQKSGSRWIKRIFSDPLIRKKTFLKIYSPKKDFILGKKNREVLWKGFPLNTIVSPLYVRYEDFLLIPKPVNYKAFWVMRDPRDLVISRYFSVKYSHAVLNEQIEKERKFLTEVSIEEGIRYFINAVSKKHRPLYASMSSWLKSEEDPNVIICKYEDLIDKNQGDSFRNIFNHCGLDLQENQLITLLDKYSFEKLSKGRKQGSEDPKSHFRKGISGDWKNYFTQQHKQLFKDLAGKLLIDLEYEKDNNW